MTKQGLILAVLALSRAALAEDRAGTASKGGEEEPARAAPEATLASTRKVRLGGMLDFMPLGSWGTSADTFGLEPAWGVGAFFAYDVHPNLAFGFAPRVIAHITDENSSISTTEEVDLRVRGEFGNNVTPKVRLSAILDLGYSFVMLPPQYSLADRWSGFILAAGAGFTYDLTQRAFLVAQLGYQVGFQQLTVRGEPSEL